MLMINPSCNPQSHKQNQPRYGLYSVGQPILQTPGEKDITLCACTHTRHAQSVLCSIHVSKCACTECFLMNDDAKQVPHPDMQIQPLSRVVRGVLHDNDA